MILYKLKSAFQTQLSKFKFTAKFLALHFLYRNHLTSKGWFESRFKRMPIDKSGLPIPWFTYSSIYFIEQKLKDTNLSIFEFGSGNSTLFFASKVQSVVSVEYDPDFYNLIKPQLSEWSNVDYILANLGENYYQQILNYKDTFDIIIIDGRERVECAKNCLAALKEDGIIIWDNSDRGDYNEGYRFLIENDFKQIDFRGLGPIGVNEWQTSIFYRTKNCFNI